MLLIIGEGTVGGPKFSKKYHDPLVVRGMLDVGSVEEMIGTGAT